MTESSIEEKIMNIARVFPRRTNAITSIILSSLPTIEFRIPEDYQGYCLVDDIEWIEVNGVEKGPSIILRRLTI